MKILFLGYKNCKVLNFLSSKYTVVQTEDKMTFDDYRGVDYIISFGYKHIINKQIIDLFHPNIINLHISYLPYNRGYHPNFWSFKDNTPKGVTIHLIDEGIDTGDILIQKEIIFSKEEDTLSKTYNRLIEEIQNLFIENCDNILKRNLKPKKQKVKGTFHYEKDLQKHKDLLTKEWNTKINKL
tara:strand:- start:2244 stop:2792 length:549 start_codon:yes stop_codon:yes gene_type:complete